MKRIQFYVNDSFYACAVQEAKKQGRDHGDQNGVGSLAKGALRAYLNKNGYTVHQLDKMPSTALPEARRGNSKEIKA